ncbi:regulatory signaling modulator protein AmpE [Simiduia aestuariiviva]|uniref:Membrane protein required for beta-lactamase induction n=1 Tax=Simiduia aestuariiviva TaxID=1510459 RepID=A0A839UUM4_9GAMM|nr:regulatory signaling modulator protein AmpE [Simiduia aestuariiviva]MBB3169077.1 membrane protein required for beta-lactamase induction [Simiduia aestuariiviva]
MGFLSLLCVLLLVQLWGSGGPLQQDGLFVSGTKRVANWGGALVQLLLLVFLPVVILFGVCLVLQYQLSSHLLLVINIPVLLYALGRGRLDALVQNYRDAWQDQDKAAACEAVDALRLDGEASCQTDGRWEGVHAEAFQAVSYRGFERMFAVLFWFAVLGAPGALLYRLAAQAARAPELASETRGLSHRLLWILEWPVARLYYLSVAVVGDFVASAERWRVLGLCMKSPTPMVVEAFNRGALSLDGALIREVAAGDAAALKEIDQLVSLMGRALILWVCAAALIALLVGG